jgi:2'-5' RNA ligase
VVAEPQPDEPRARLFVALDPPDRVREALSAWQRQALGDPALRAMRPEALHVTLCFLGARPEREIDRLATLLATVRARPVNMAFDAEAAPVPKGRPRLYALGAESPEAVALQREIARLLEAEGLYEPEPRAFWPHVTVARVRSERLPPGRGERRGRGRPRRVSEPPRPLPATLKKPFEAVRFALYRSKLKPQGAEYERLTGVDLPSPKGGGPGRGE